MKKRQINEKKKGKDNEKYLVDSKKKYFEPQQCASFISNCLINLKLYTIFSVILMSISVFIVYLEMKAVEYEEMC